MDRPEYLVASPSVDLPEPDYVQRSGSATSPVSSDLKSRTLAKSSVDLSEEEGSLQSSSRSHVQASNERFVA